VVRPKVLLTAIRPAARCRAWRRALRLSAL